MVNLCDRRRIPLLDFHKGISFWGLLEASSLVLGLKLERKTFTSETILLSFLYQLSCDGLNTVSHPLGQRVPVATSEYV